MMFDFGPHIDFALRTTSLRNHPTVNKARRHQRKRFSHRLSTRGATCEAAAASEHAPGTRQAATAQDARAPWRVSTGSRAPSALAHVLGACTHPAAGDRSGLAQVPAPLRPSPGQSRRARAPRDAALIARDRRAPSA